MEWYLSALPFLAILLFGGIALVTAEREGKLRRQRLLTEESRRAQMKLLAQEIVKDEEARRLASLARLGRLGLSDRPEE